MAGDAGANFGWSFAMLRLVIGNKNYSSWSMRPWLAMQVAGIAFDEVLIPLYDGDYKAAILRHSPTGKVPCLIDGDLRVWESLAILEHLAERFPDRGLWPADGAARAEARSVAAEMHAGFSAVRRLLPMNLARPIAPRALTSEAAANVTRVLAIWRSCRERFGAGGPFLFGAFSAADAMFAPVVTRFRTYDVAVDEDAAAYMAAVESLPAFKAWKAAALKEPWVIEASEVDWPEVKRMS
ncbi:glutathione S-transferase [Blastochloris viridis]|uniref:Glutathione S-transferase n=2 Tax=Blastochloris viridis TaxID=1079 RepID=A0A182D682_BLAVI|nr:glutathione S-transferase [Blastochloris viridis]